MGRLLLGIALRKFGNIVTIGQYISTKLPQKGQTWHLTQRKKNPEAKKRIQNQTKTQLRSKISLEELKPLLPWQSRNFPVAQEPLVQQIHPCLKQVRFLERPNFQPQKSVRFLHHWCPKENNPPPYRRHPGLKRPVVLQDPHKPPLYPPQLSPRHNRHQAETPKEQHHCLLLLHQHQLQSHARRQEEAHQTHHQQQHQWPHRTNHAS